MAWTYSLTLGAEPEPNLEELLQEDSRDLVRGVRMEFPRHGRVRFSPFLRATLWTIGLITVAMMAIVALVNFKMSGLAPFLTTKRRGQAPVESEAAAWDFVLATRYHRYHSLRFQIAIGRMSLLVFSFPAVLDLQFIPPVLGVSRLTPAGHLLSSSPRALRSLTSMSSASTRATVWCPRSSKSLVLIAGRLAVATPSC